MSPAAPPTKADLQPAIEQRSELVQFLAWDFVETFPPVLPDAIDARVVEEEDALPENLAALHADHAAVMLAALSDLETVGDARRRGVNPKTGKPPRGKKEVELPAALAKEIERLQRWYRTLLETSADARRRVVDGLDFEKKRGNRLFKAGRRLRSVIFAPAKRREKRRPR